MQTGWYQDNNSKWYYLDLDKGYCYTNCTILIDSKNYTFDSNGVWIENNDSLVSDDCVNFVKNYEGFSSTPYYDGTGYTDSQLTIGYGTTKASEPEAFNNTPITEEIACYYLKKEIDKMAKIIKADLDNKGVSLTQSQQDGLYSFAYNCGESALLGSTLYKYISNGGRDANTIQSYFCMWDKAGGVELSGLKARRIAEANIFNYGVYNSTH
jgi:GH24 family phage-related lysozyme (muramidase)